MALVARLAGLTAVAAIAAAVTVPPTPSLAAEGATELVLSGSAAKSLRAQGVKVSPVGPARGGQRRVTLPLRGGLAGTTATVLSQRGGIVLARRGHRPLRVSRISVQLAERGRLEASVGGATLTLARLAGGSREVDAAAGTVALRGQRLLLTAAARRLLAARLGLERTPGQRLGTLSALARGLAASGGESGGGGSGGGSGPVANAAACPLPSGAGPAPESPPTTMSRPPGALDVTAATIDWHVRESFIQYIASGEGTSVSGDASADPPVLAGGSSAPLSYDFHFPFASGWIDTAGSETPADDTALLEFGGALRFHYSAHGIDLTAADPEIELAGSSSRAIFAISEAGGAPERQVLVNLDLSRAAAITAAGGTYTYERVPGAIPAGTATSTFAGFYTPGTEFGCFTVSFATGG